MTQIGFVGLGKMGGNMVHRIRRDSEHEVVAFDFDQKAVAQAVAQRRRGRRLAEGAGQEAAAPADGVDHGPGGRAHAGDRRQARQAARPRRHDHRRRQLASWTDDKRRAGELKRSGIDYVDVGVSGGVWGLEVGYCMMVGGPTRAVKRLAPILDVLAPADQRAEPRRDRRPRLAALRPVRRRALREDGPQRRRVRADAGLRRGLRRVRQVRVRARQRQDRPPLGPGLGGPLVAVRTGRPGLRSGRQRPRQRSRATPRTPARAAGRSRTRPPTTCPPR